MMARSRAPRSVTVKLTYSPPFDFDALLGFLGPRAIPGVEQVADGAYTRTFAVGTVRGTARVRAIPREHALSAHITTSDGGAVDAIVRCIRHLFDLDTDCALVDARLRKSRPLAPLVRARPGIRVPGAFDGFEMVVRAVLGQQISVKAATTIAGRIVARAGHTLAPDEGDPNGPRMLFPSAAELCALDLSGLGLTGARSVALSRLAARIADDQRILARSETLAASIAKLTALPGFGPWTAHYVAMRALREPDAFPEGDLGLLRALAVDGVRPTPRALLAVAEAWRPFRAYAAIRLWLSSAL